MMVEYGQTMLQRAASASSGAVAGLTTPATAGVPTASGGPRATAAAYQGFRFVLAARFNEDVRRFP
jgi:phosphate-selective porin